MEKVRVIIVEDEPVARRGLRTYVRQHPRMEVVGECANGYEAIDAIEKLCPDLVLLDIEMPELNGFQVLERITSAKMPFVVFVTAHNEYALEAFKVHALDYVLKPVDKERMISVLDRVLVQIERSSLEEFKARLDLLLRQFEKQKERPDNGGFLNRIVVKDSGRIFFLDAASIDWIEACGNYVNLHVGQSKYLLKETMNNLESKLDSSVFLRVHRSTIVNTRSVREFRPFLRGSYLVLMKDNTKLFSSRRFHPRIQSFLGDVS